MTEICSQRRRRSLKGIVIHLDNARPHNSKESTQVLQDTKARRASHPPYSPDLAPSDFFLFGALKEKLAGSSFSGPDDLISAIHQKFGEFTKDTLLRVYKNWAMRLQWVIEHDGEYYH
jgi:transposase